MSIGELEPYARVLEAMHKLWKPHAAQIPPGRALFYENVKRIWLRLARQTGKSSLCAYLAVRWALTHPRAQIFIIGPLLTQTRAIYLHSGLIRTKCPEAEFPVEVHIADGRFTFPHNGSQIKILGSDQPDSLRGLTADLVIVDEIKEIKEDLWPVIYPTLLVKRAPLIIAGTPPGDPTHYYHAMDEEARTNPDWRYYKAKSAENPYIDPVDIEKERQRHIARGEESIFLREYEAEYAVDERRAVFPMFDPKVHVKPYEYLRNQVIQRPAHWQFMVSWDPAYASVSGVLIGAVNNYSGQVFFLDEMYVTDQGSSSVGAMWPIIQKKMDEIYMPANDENPWSVVVDEAAAGTRVELLDVFDIPSMPTAKALHRKSYGIGMLKDLYVSKKLLVSDRCVNFVKETQGYFLNEKGEYTKTDDHLCSDAARYLLHAANYTFRNSVPPPDPREIPLDERRRGYTPEQDFAELTGGYEPYLLDLE